MQNRIYEILKARSKFGNLFCIALSVVDCYKQRIKSWKKPFQKLLHFFICFITYSFIVLFPYEPQNEDELELLEGDIVKVVEKCDDGWFVGISERTGDFGTFPGNYVKLV